MTTKQLLQTNAMARWITGLGLFEYPINRPRILLCIFHASCLVSLYLYTYVKYFQIHFISVNMVNISPKPRIYLILSCMNMAFFLVVLVNAWYRKKTYYFWCKQVDEIRMTMNSIGCRANDKSLMRFQYIFNIFIFLYVMLLTHRIHLNLYYLSLNFYASFMYYALYTVLVILFANAEFCYSVRYMSLLFGELNRKLSDMLPLGESQQVRVELDASTERHYIKEFKTIRRLHLELVRSSLYVNDLYALQNLMLMMISITTTAIFFYEVYNLQINKINELYNTSIMQMFLCLSNIVTVNLSCTRATEEIRQFTLQLIDNRLLFKVCGLFNLGRRFFTMVVNAIITYLVILIQITYLQSADTVDAGSTMPPSDLPK